MKIKSVLKKVNLIAVLITLIIVCIGLMIINLVSCSKDVAQIGAVIKEEIDKQRVDLFKVISVETEYGRNPAAMTEEEAEEDILIITIKCEDQKPVVLRMFRRDAKQLGLE